MKFLFIVQGEGRGHMTQAISLSSMLRSNGHEIVHVLVGKSNKREIPTFFFDKIGTKVSPFESPNFVMDKSHKKISIGRTILFNAFKLVTFQRSLKQIHKVVKQTKPDVIVNFYDLLAGLYSGIYRPQCKYICIGHQYLLNHPEFQFPKGYKVDKFLMRINTTFASLRSEKHLALSFRPMKNIEKKKIYVVPPLLRSEITDLMSENQGYILGYMLNPGYAEDIQKWHETHADQEIHFFWDKKDAPEELKVNPKLTFHKINDKKFLDMMSKCGAYSSTAGFESICEAMYLGKPIMMVPNYGHFEQACNALDASIAGGGIKSDTFDLSKLLEYMPKHKDITKEFKDWANSSQKMFLDLLTR